MLKGATTNASFGGEGKMGCCDFGRNMHKLTRKSFYLPWTSVDFGQFHFTIVVAAFWWFRGLPVAAGRR